MTTLAELKADAIARYRSATDYWNGGYWFGRLEGLRLAEQCDRLTSAEQAVIEAALGTGDLGEALQALRKERDI